jgi:ribosomal protein S18 acetylase RimI-like enzyme
LTRIAKERQLGMVEIGAAVTNQNALRLYRRLGFTNERQIMLPNSEEAILLSKIIS